MAKRKRKDDAAVERALLQSAVGGVHPVRKSYKVRRIEYDDETGRKRREYEEIVYGTEEAYDAPSVSAQQFWLKNRLPGTWGGEGPPQDGEAGIIELPAQEAPAEGPGGTEAAAF